ncbi:MAG: nucleoside 2-deoxyribosyltransferase domain-containing protein, partial [Peptoniphilaceae bacterium]|nr:nucleoside 2-deoxyribosyltransferase domain-containing protein [Peptoniphilaceae bacterium]
MTKKVYLAGDIMSKGSQMQRQWELNEIKKKNISVYDPKDEDDINDKKNMSVEENNKLAEKIVKKDSENIYNADVVI